MTAHQSGVPCPVCHTALALRLAKGRKSGKPFLMLICPVNGRHLRACITDQGYVKQLLAATSLELPTPQTGTGGGRG